MFKPTPFQIDHDRFYYEPRVLWSVRRVGNLLETKTDVDPAGFVQMDKTHFMNGTPYPIRITNAIVSPVGYLYRSRVAASDAQNDSAMAGLGRMLLRIAFPKSSWIERLETDVMSFGTEPVAEQGFDDDTALDHSSGLLGVSRWTFDPSYIVPQKATIELMYSTIQLYASQNPTPADAIAAMAVFERGGRMLGHARTRPPAAIEYGATWVAAAVNAPAWPESHAPVIGDFFAANTGVNGPQAQAFPASGKWPADTYNRQLSSRGLPYTEVTGFAFAIDQADVDDQILAGLAGTAPRLAPLSQRIITKGRTRDAGTQERWWRDGAPLSLVTPTQNNAGFVHRFADPFVLGPGEGVEISLKAPPPRTFTSGQQPVTVNPVYNVGVSLLGYACVQDNNVKVFRSPPT